jgi:hypothetical protein
VQRYSALMPAHTGRKYYPLTLVAKPITCCMCAATAKSETELQLHMNTAHPGWLDVAVRKILGTAFSKSGEARGRETVTARR